MPSTATRERSVSCHYDRELTAPGQARDMVSKALFRWGLREHADLAEIIISELVTNAVIHGEGPVMTRVSYDGRNLRMEVHDDGPGRPVWRQAGAEDESGRGLTLIDGLIWLNGGSLGVEDDAEGDGKTVWISACLAGGQ
jgi:anti-sigma regulatory factor (Ser/Thr protein kinase)